MKECKQFLKTTLDIISTALAKKNNIGFLVCDITNWKLNLIIYGMELNNDTLKAIYKFG